MRYLAAYLLLSLKGTEPTPDAIKKLLSESDVTIDEGKLNLFFQKIEGKNIDEIVEEGRKKLASVSGGVARAGGASASTTTEETTTESAPAKEDEPEEDEGPMLDLFGDDY